MAILIDGHNLIGQLSGLALSDPDDEAKLVQRLKIYRKVTNQPITVVFDSGSSYTPPHNLSGGGVEVVFAGLSTTADQHIISRIRQRTGPQDLVVVSSDHEIQNVARAHGAAVVPSEEFASQMTRTRPPRHRKRRQSSREQNLSAREVQEWLALFRNRSE